MKKVDNSKQQQSLYKPINAEETKAVLKKADMLLQRVHRNFKTGEEIIISNEEYCLLQKYVSDMITK